VSARGVRVVAASLAIGLLGACALPPAAVGIGRSPWAPVVVVGVAAAGPDASDRARASALDRLHERLHLELVRRENRRHDFARPGERVRDWEAAESELTRSAESLLDADPRGVSTTGAGDAFLASRIDPAAFGEAVERARAVGRAGPVRVAVVPPAVPSADESGARWLYGLRDLYSVTLRQTLEGDGGVTILDERLVYGALDEAGARGDRPIDTGKLVQACAALRADAFLHGRIDPVDGGIEVTLELRDGTDGRVLGRLDATVSSALATLSLARRHALLLVGALGSRSQ
jgi:hypothetical protein